MTTDQRVIHELRQARDSSSAVELAELIDSAIPGGLSKGSFVRLLHRAFPEIPLQTLVEAAAWYRVGGGMSDSEFGELLSPWLRSDEIINNWKNTRDLEAAYKLAESASGGRIHHRIFKEIVFPVIKSGIENNVERDVMAAVKCIQNLYGDKTLWEQIGYKTEINLLHGLIENKTTNKMVIDAYVVAVVEWLKYCIHEWPDGVLYGHDSASINECGDILNTVKRIRAMTTDKLQLDLLDGVEEKTIMYVNRLKCSQQADAPEPLTRPDDP